MAAHAMENEGYRILERNFSCKTGEIDIIAREKEYLVFCEVKYRKTKGAGDPTEAVNYRKQRKICMTASYYMMCKNLKDDVPVRFDVVSILGDEVRIIRNAFPYCL